MSLIKYPVVFLLFFCPFLAPSQTETKPRYAPRKEEHRNKSDELGKKQGVWKFYSEAGNIIWEVVYLDDIKHGISKRYFSESRLMRETEYKYGIREGIYRRYYLNGQLKQEGEYESNKRSGKWTNLFSSGNVQSEGLYINGVKDGVWKYYNQKGELINVITFVKGKDQREIIAAEKRAAEKKALAEKQRKLKLMQLYQKNQPAAKDSLRL
jgi:antitoxin component YwqK of YwqJK toxin-antitoxin module